MNSLGKLGKFYRRLLCRHPVLLHSIQTGLLMGAGDVIAQKVIENKCHLNYLRTAQFVTVGALAVGPALTKWYKFLDRFIGSCGKTAAVKKVLLDQLIFAPSFLVVFLVALNALQGKDFECIKREICNKYMEILISNYKVWPAVQLINFYITPLAYQVLVVQVVALLWNAYLSWKTQEDIEDKK